MSSDGFGLFSECHRLYIQGVRRALRECLESAYGENWFKYGVLAALSEDQNRNLQIALEREHPTELETFLDAPHFTRIVARNHAVAFADAFTNIDSTLQKFRELASIRNEWAHIPPEGLPLPKVMPAIQAMKDILVALRCREALEIDRMSQGNPNQLENSMQELPIATEESDSENYLDELAAAPLDLWRDLQSYIVLDSFIDEIDTQSRRGAKVTVRVSNAAPSSEGRPEVYFKTVTLHVSGQNGPQSTQLGELGPGQTKEKQFEFAPKGLATVEFQVSGDVDTSKLFRIHQKGGLPGEVVRPLLREFAERFEEIGIKQPMEQSIASIAKIRPTMTLEDASEARKDLEQIEPLIDEKVAALQELFREFHLNKQSTLGAQCNDVWVYLRDLQTRIQAVDNAISETDPESITQAVHHLEQLQISVLQLEETIRAAVRS